MIAIDTNVLLRRLLNDDEAQAKRARMIFDRASQILITDVVLVETIWTLRGKRYKASKDDVEAVVMGLLEEPNVVFESQQAVWSALNDYVNAPSVKTTDGMRTADLADALVVNKAKVMMEQWGQPYETTYTFDQAAQALNGSKAPPLS
ncbi:type II toxin-antitoxin system VapC family toxin [Noviherbaspirillum sp. CPCC 100848]|jgi:predicted nucleic-acid-binding protein|uniref:Type II toxin-antitoxin system VapC family toxin n=1 Tax=Noviherbaspirillum album TaxID=3080276 RepID=A0ABU6J4L2_9BURK|nr:type II toxin-antitoxin system VapC family toxin [Noviherbaspirillum sp. CPCC 100848]MEC4718383.1 type II toxin-antitoxin system VapC family toxin [Noviherbaspirillum sp. CPCC 100848]